METKKQRIENTLLWRVAVFIGISFYFQLVLSQIFTLFNKDYFMEHITDLSLIFPIIAVDIVGLPVLYFLIKKLPKNKLGQEKVSIGRFIIGIPVMTFLVIVGNIVGTAIQGLVTPATASGGLDELMFGSSFIWRVLYIGVLAPVVEELVFRKFMIDVLSAKGKWFAIIVESLVFALFHANLAQFFYAFALGIIWGVIYTKTGKIYISMAYHFIINMSSSVLAVYIMSLGETPITIYAAIRVGLAVVGLVIFAITAKKFFTLEDEEGLKGGKIFKTIFTSWGFYLIFAMCLMMYLLNAASADLAVRVMGGEKVTADTIEITVTEGQTDIEQKVYDIELAEDGTYAFSFDWYENEDPAFITGVRVEDENGNTIMCSTGARLKADMNPVALSAGKYQVVFTFCDSPEEFAQYCEKYCEDVDGSCEYEKFNVDGKYKMKYSFGYKMQ